MKSRITCALALLTLAFWSTGELHAWTWKTCDRPDGTQGLQTWDTPQVFLHASAIGFPAGSPWRSALAEVAGQWNITPSRFHYVMEYNDVQFASGNKQSEVYWLPVLENNAPAHAVPWIYKDTCVLAEVDIVFNADPTVIQYTTSHDANQLSYYGGLHWSFQSAAMHEFGHAQGLAHTANVYNVMGSSWSPCT